MPEGHHRIDMSVDLHTANDSHAFFCLDDCVQNCPLLFSLSLSLLASLCTLPSCLLRPNPFFCHPALLGPNHCLLPTTHFADRTSHLSSLFSRCCLFLRSHFAAVTSNFASGNPSRFQSTPPCASPSLARRNARSD